MVRLKTSCFVCRERPREHRVPRMTTPLTRCCVLTAGPSARRVAMYQDAFKRHTYRPPRICRQYSSVAGVWFTCVQAVRGSPNCRCMFRLRPGPPPPAWPRVNTVYRVEWDWSQKLWAQGCSAYEIYDLIVFPEAITIDYRLGAMWAAPQDMQKLRTQYLQWG